MLHLEVCFDVVVVVFLACYLMKYMYCRSAFSFVQKLRVRYHKYAPTQKSAKRLKHTDVFML